MLRTSTTTNIFTVLASLCLVTAIRPLNDEINGYNRLCEFFSNEATRERLKLCQTSENNQKAVRVRREVNTTQKAIQSSTDPQVITTRGPPSYSCRKPTISSNGFSFGVSVQLTLKWKRDRDMWSAVVTWEVPKSEAGKANCTGYVIQWALSDGSSACDYMVEEDVTSYSIGSSHGWKSTCVEREKLFIAVLPQPFASSKGEIDYRSFEPPACSDPTITTMAITSAKTRTPSTAPNITIGNTVKNATNNTKTGPSSSTTRGPVVTKLVFAIVISIIAIVIVAILFLLYKRKRAPPGKFPNNKIMNGDPHYISYNANNERESMAIARWLKDRHVNVIIDKFSFIIFNRRVWGEQQLLEAKKIIMIITPHYLEICTSPKTKSHKQNNFSWRDELVNNEISLIKNRLIDTADDKIIAILIDTQEKDLPHWMSDLHCFQYKNGKLDEEILRVLKPCTFDRKNNNHQKITV